MHWTIGMVVGVGTKMGKDAVQLKVVGCMAFSKLIILATESAVATLCTTSVHKATTFAVDETN